MEKMLRKIFEAELKEWNDKELTVTHFISTERRDRGGDILLSDGMTMEGRPVVLHSHGWGPMGQEPIAKPVSIGKGEFRGSKGIIAKTQFFPDETGKRLFAKTTQGFMPSWSIGWRPLEWKMKSEPNGEETRIVSKWELLEYSLVGVPMQPDAQTLDVDKGLGNLMFKMIPKAEEELGELIAWEKEDGTWEEKPYPNEHACRLEDPKKYVRIRRQNDKFGKGVHAIWGVLKAGGTELQALRFSKSQFTPAEARKWLKDHEYKCKEFEPATSKCEACGHETLYIKPEKAEDSCLIETVDLFYCACNAIQCPDCKAFADLIESEKPFCKTCRKEIEMKGTLPYKKTKLDPEDSPWNGLEESRKADYDGLKEMAVWFDEKNPNRKSSYKGIHHRGDKDHAAVWKGVRVLASNLLNARGGIHIPTQDLAKARLHCEKHYKDFGKGNPPWKNKEGKQFVDAVMEFLSCQFAVIKEGDKHTLFMTPANGVAVKAVESQTPITVEEGKALWIHSKAGQLVPDLAEFFDPAYKQDDWNNMIDENGDEDTDECKLTEDETVNFKMVDGDSIRDLPDGTGIEFTMDRHHYVDPKLVPEEDVILIDRRMTDIDLIATKCHAFIERELQKYCGFEYDDAHEVANIGEEGVRHILDDEEDGGHGGNSNGNGHWHNHGGDHHHDSGNRVVSHDWERMTFVLAAPGQLKNEVLSQIKDLLEKEQSIEEIAKAAGLEVHRFPSMKKGQDGKPAPALTLPTNITVVREEDRQKEMAKILNDISSQVVETCRRVGSDIAKAEINRLKGRVE